MALYTLLTLSLLAYIAGMVKGRHDPTPYRRFARWGKLIMIACFVGIAALSIGEVPAGALRPAAWLILVGLVLGGAGDVILADLTPLRHPLMPGMGVFALGHVAYTAAIGVLFGVLGWQPGLTLMGIGAAWAVVGLGWYRLIRVSAAASKAVRLGILFYALLLTGVMAAAWVLAASNLLLIALAAGLTLFVISDSLLALEIAEVWRFPLMGDLVWIIYAAGQTIIALSLLTFAGALN